MCHVSPLRQRCLGLILAHALVLTFHSRAHTYPALVVHVARGAEPLRSDFATENAGGFDAILSIVGVVAWYRSGRRGEGIKLSAKRVHAVGWRGEDGRERECMR